MGEVQLSGGLHAETLSEASKALRGGWAITFLSLFEMNRVPRHHVLRKQGEDHFILFVMSGDLHLKSRGVFVGRAAKGVPLGEDALRSVFFCADRGGDCGVCAVACDLRGCLPRTMWQSSHGLRQVQRLHWPGKFARGDCVS